jgi:hypothetical protein
VTKRSASPPALHKYTPQRAKTAILWVPCTSNKLDSGRPAAVFQLLFQLPSSSALPAALPSLRILPSGKSQFRQSMVVFPSTQAQHRFHLHPSRPSLDPSVHVASEQATQTRKKFAVHHDAHHTHSNASWSLRSRSIDTPGARLCMGATAR